MTSRRGQAMVEFALIVPILMAVIFLVVATTLVYAVRIEEHKAAYDAARHVAKTYRARINDTLPDGYDQLHGCYGADNKLTDDGVEDSARSVLNFHYNHSNLMSGFADPPELAFVSTGPPVNNDNYYCVQAMSVVIRYRMKIPGWDYLEALYGARDHNLTEIGLATRLGRDYE